MGAHDQSTNQCPYHIAMVTQVLCTTNTYTFLPSIQAFKHSYQDKNVAFMAMD